MDENGPQLFEISPTGNYFSCLAVSIGARAQSSKTYFERHVEEFEKSSVDELINHGLKAVRDALSQDNKITVENLSIGVVGKDLNFNLLQENDLKKHLDALESSDTMETD